MHILREFIIEKRRRRISRKSKEDRGDFAGRFECPRAGMDHPSLNVCAKGSKRNKNPSKKCRPINQRWLAMHACVYTSFICEQV